MFVHFLLFGLAKIPQLCFFQAVHLVIEEQEKMKQLKKEIFKQIRTSPVGNFCAADGTPDESAIRKYGQAIA